MNQFYLDKMNSFQENSLPFLDESVLAALELLDASKIKPLEIDFSVKTAIVASGKCLFYSKNTF